MEKAPELHQGDRADDWGRFLKKPIPELGEISRLFPHKRSLLIDYRQIERFGKAGITLADELVENPGKVLEDVWDAIKNDQLIRTKDGKEPKGVNIRFTNLPKKTAIREIRSDDINKFISVEGILRKTTEVRPGSWKRSSSVRPATSPKRPRKYGKFIEPDGCATDGCTFKKLELIPKRSTFVDSQKLRVQESPEGLRGGEQPQTLDIDVTDDLSGMVAPGDRVVINGILRSMQRVVKGEKHTVFDIFLDCNSIEIAEKEFEEVEIDEKAEDEIKKLSCDPMIYRMVTHSIAPTIYGNEDVKEAITLQLFGGIAKEMPDGTTCGGISMCS